ncbi:hypothetical protein [Winogradskya humida]|uniref:Uncharacterized protein n=1 Tax=Winogradskya humida TaxID=113566 RepID=A0ABQ3ZUE1_9ACTN|nr:hypothetical protein [Actinoplanes humidus]GIE22221.1 hypothetical protein Ahu01nite_053230 [Actinoplanes humidus]
MGKTAKTVGGIAAAVVAICCAAGVLSSIGEMFDQTPYIWPAIGAAVVVALGAALAYQKVQTGRAKRELDAWTDWEDIGTDGPWPWAMVLTRTSVATPTAAWSGWADGFPVKAGVITWSGMGLRDLTGKFDGTGVFACVHLPRPLPLAAVHLRPDATGKTFDERFQVKGTIGDVQRIVHVDNTVPPWTITGVELFVIVPVAEPIRPRHIQDIALRAAWAAQLAIKEVTTPGGSSAPKPGDGHAS